MIEIILGPPGTGKTTTLLNIVMEELERGTPPDRIGYFSFTRRAAEEARTRACEKFNLPVAAFPHFRTLHSHCYAYLGLRSHNVCEGKKLQEFGESIGYKITGRVAQDGTATWGYGEGDRILFMEHLARVRCIPLLKQYAIDDDGLDLGHVLYVSQRLLEFKQREGLLDYTDMLSEYIRSGGRPKLDVLIVDEAQDLSQLQWRVVDELRHGTRRMVVAGDDDQAIYPWAGADLQHFINLQGKVTVLGQSWRVPHNIQTVAMDIIRRVHHRRPKDWSPRIGVAGELQMAYAFERAEISGETLVLTRNLYFLERILPDLRGRGIVYEYNGHPSISPKVRDAITNWERLRRGEAIDIAQARAVYSFISSGPQGIKRGFKQLSQFPEDAMVTMHDLRERGGLFADGVWYDVLDMMPSIDKANVRAVLHNGNKLTDAPRVRVSTIHGSKGGQADHVILLREMVQRTWDEYQNNPEDEARVWYVGVTRAKQKLTLVGAETNREFII